jgi:hypothetical protein
MPTTTMSGPARRMYEMLDGMSAKDRARELLGAFEAPDRAKLRRGTFAIQKMFPVHSKTKKKTATMKMFRGSAKYMPTEATPYVFFVEYEDGDSETMKVDELLKFATAK